MSLANELCSSAISTRELADCLIEKTHQAELELKRYIDTAKSRFKGKPGLVKLIDASQQSWEEYKKAHCDAVYKEWEEGTIRFINHPYCLLAAVIANAHGMSYSNNLLVSLAERGVPFVLCAANHNAVGMLWSVDGHHRQAKRFDAQLAAKKSLLKRLWADIVRTKLRQQAAVLEAIGETMAPLTALISKVKSGDPQNIEAQGARRYWGLLFDEGFRLANQYL